MKKLISILLIFSSLLYLTGCYSMREVTKEEFSSQKDYDKALVVTKDNMAYQFNEGKYTINSDTLTGSGVSLSGNKEMPYSGKIALDDVTTFNLEKFNTEIVVLVTIIILGVGALAASDFNSGWGGGLKF